MADGLGPGEGGEGSNGKPSGEAGSVRPASKDRLQGAVCIVTAGAMSSAPRVVREAAILSRLGLKVTVVCRNRSGVAQVLDLAGVMRAYSGAEAPAGPSTALMPRLQYLAARNLFGPL